MATVSSSDPVAIKSEKKHKKDKSEKKRSREEDGETGRKHKKSKSIVDAEAVIDVDEEDIKTKKKEKKDKKSKSKGSEKEERKKKKKSKKESVKEEDSDADQHDDTDAQIEDQLAQSAEIEPEAMDVDEKPLSDVYQPPDIPANPQFPFYSQTVSLYEPIYPVGWAEPVTNSEYQHLKHLLNRYVPSLRGVLMNYSNVALGDEPGRNGAATTDEEPTKLKSQYEFGVGFGWITADVELFVPSRGAWMEGSVNLQTEGHIGVVCFGKFNASIEARRLPSSWKWIANEDPEAEGMEEMGSVIAPDEHGVVRQIHSTGFWVDAQGDKVKGKIRFRIRNFDVGMSGDTTYLSLEGTMLGKVAEKALVKEEAETAKLRKDRKGGRRVERRRAPEFSMTRFETEEDKQKAEEAGGAEASLTATEEGTKIVFDE